MSVQDTDAAIEAALEKEMDFKDDPATAPDPADDQTTESTPEKTDGQQQPATETGTPTDPSTTPTGEAPKEPVPATTEPVASQPHPVMKGYNLDKDGNITDAQGQVVAAAGRERRWFETSETLHNYVASQREEIATLKTRIGEVAATSKEAMDGIPARLGLNTDEVGLGLKLAAGFKSDPVETARYIVAEAMKLGYNLEQIVETAGSNNLNMTAIRQLLDDRLGPVAEKRTEEQEAQTQEQNGIDAYNVFMRRFPDAAHHQEQIAAVANHYKIAPEDAYFELRKWANRHGYDFNQPLQPQMQRASQPANGPSTAPLPSGGIPQGGVTDTPQIASDDVDYDDIIKESMREAGMTIT